MLGNAQKTNVGLCTVLRLSYVGCDVGLVSTSVFIVDKLTKCKSRRRQSIAPILAYLQRAVLSAIQRNYLFLYNCCVYFLALPKHTLNNYDLRTQIDGPGAVILWEINLSYFVDSDACFSTVGKSALSTIAL